MITTEKWTPFKNHYKYSYVWKNGFYIKINSDSNWALQHQVRYMIVRILATPKLPSDDYKSVQWDLGDYYKKWLCILGLQMVANVR